MYFEAPYKYDQKHQDGKPPGFNDTSYVWSSSSRYQSIPAENRKTVFPGKVAIFGFDQDIKNSKSKYTESKASKQSQKQPKELQDVFISFADTTSLQGVPFIKRASRWYAKLIWILVFLSATGAWIFHSYYLINTFLQYETSSSVVIAYEHAPFPSVTFCNINPLKSSTLSTYGSKSLLAFMESTKPKQAFTPRGSNTPNQPGSGNGPPGPNSGAGRRKLLAVNNGPQGPAGKKNSQLQFYEYSDYENQQDVYISNGGINWTSLSYMASDYQDVISDPTAPATVKATAVFKELVAKMPRSNRTKGGHSLSDMMLSCSYNGEECSARNFTKTLDINYGNCWTFNSESLLQGPLMSVRGGANTGLDIMLNIQEYDYLKGLNMGRGMRIHLHPFNSMPFVADSGISLTAGKQTYIGVRAIHQIRLGGIYGPCNDDNGQFVSYYNQAYIYTLDGCINTCLDRTIAATCNCYRKTQMQYYRVSDVQNMSHCSSIDEQSCVRELSFQFTSGNLTCGCMQACTSVEYEAIVTADTWPDETLWFSLVDAICQRDDTSVSCRYFEAVEQADRDTILKKNFLHLKVYYRDLNVQRIEEKAQYEVAQFASDFGGAIGLWLGASAITVIEFMDLFCQICRFCRRKEKYKARKESKNRNNSIFDSIGKTKLPRTVFKGNDYSS